MPEETTKTSNKKVYVILIIVILLLTGSFFLPFFGGLPELTNWLFSIGKKKPPTIEEIMESVKPTAPREYVFQEPSKETLARKIDCKSIKAFTEMMPQNPLCLNMYKTSAEEIDREISTGKYDRVILYGQNLIFDTPSKWEIEDVPGRSKPADTSDKRDGLAERIYSHAKFNDQVTLPAMLKLFGFSSMKEVASIIGGNLPYPAIYSRVTNYNERRTLCHVAESQQGAPLGCTRSYWANVTYYPNPLSEPMSMPDQRVHRLGREDFLYFDQMAPANCYADESLMHETAHNLFDLSMYAGGHGAAIDQITYYNEHQAGLVGDMYSGIACGESNIGNFHTNKNVPFKSIVAYNSIYPASEMSGSHPEGDKCKLAVLTQWNKILNTGKWNEQFAKFYAAVRDKKYAFTDGKGFQKFMADVSGDSQAKSFLNSYGCGL